MEFAFSNNVSKSSLFTREDTIFQNRYKEYFSQIKKKKGLFILKEQKREFKLPKNSFEINVFYHKLGLKEINLKFLDNIRQKTFLDVGAFIGDSILILDNYGPKKIIAVEPSSENLNDLKKTLKENKIKTEIQIKKVGVGYKEGEFKLTSEGCGSAVNSTKGEDIEIKRIDSFCIDEDIGLIKMDIEGLELEAIKGAEKTIKKYKPLLIISLYHTPKDFFEIPFLIKRWVPGYKFRFLNLNHASPSFERVLIAYL